MTNPYSTAGVDTVAGDRAVELMKESVAATHGPEVLGGIGGFAGLFDARALRGMSHPLLATSTDGVGTKVALAQALDRHDTIGQDLVGMVVDDIVVVGARPLFMTDYIACGHVVPGRIAEIVRGIALACQATGTALVGGETAEHPGLLAPDEYDVAGAATGVVDADRVVGPERVVAGDAVVAVASSGLHSNGFSLVRHILQGAGVGYADYSAELGGVAGEVLLEPTRLYTAALLQLLDDSVLGQSVHALSHVTGGGIAANLARVLPQGSWTELSRSGWHVPAVFSALANMAGLRLQDTEETWNLGIGFFAIVDSSAATVVVDHLNATEIPAWVAGYVQQGAPSGDGFISGAKGVHGGSVRLTGDYL